MTSPITSPEFEEYGEVRIEQGPAPGDLMELVQIGAYDDDATGLRGDDRR